MNSYEISNLKLKFDRKEILNISNLNIKSGITTVIMGPSGCGKTTFLRCLNRLNELFSECEMSGEIKICLDDKLENISNFKPDSIRQKVAMLFQHPNVLPLSVEKNFSVPLIYALGLDKKSAREKMQFYLEKVGLLKEVDTRLSSPATALSGGQQQRLCLARALCFEPSILLLDEPTSSLDEASAKIVEECIKSLNITVVMVTHNAAQAERLGDEIIDFTKINLVV